jgi:hypothetical protein
MDKLYTPEVIRAINGVGWTVVRGGRDKDGPFLSWIGLNFNTFEEAEIALVEWEAREPSFGVETIH